jgi:hypothetical protein
MVAAGRRLMAALEREQAPNVSASQASDESSALTLREARELVDAAADHYMRAAQRFREFAQDHQRASPWCFGAANSSGGVGLEVR